MNEGAARIRRAVTAEVGAFGLAAQMILVFPRTGVIQGGSPAWSSWLCQLISYGTTRQIGCVWPAGIRAAIGVLAGPAVKGHDNRRLPTIRWDRLAPASGAELISDATLRPS